MLRVDKKHELTFQYCNYVTVEFDSLYFKQVLFTFVDNAIKYTPGNKRISPKTNTIDKLVMIILKDTGKELSIKK